MGPAGPPAAREEEADDGEYKAMAGDMSEEDDEATLDEEEVHSQTLHIPCHFCIVTQASTGCRSTSLFICTFQESNDKLFQ